MSLIDCITKAGKALPRAVADDILDRHEELVDGGRDTQEAAREALAAVRAESIGHLDIILSQLGLERPEIRPAATLADRAIAAIEQLELQLQGNTYSDPFMAASIFQLALRIAKEAIRAGKAINEAIRMAVAQARQSFPDAAESDGEITEALTRTIANQMAGPVREHSVKLDAAPDMTPAIQALVANRTYEVLPEADAMARAQAAYDRSGGIDRAMIVFADRNNGMHEAVRTKLGSIIMKAAAAAERTARQAGDAASADQIARAAAEFWDQHIGPRSTEVAQALQAFADFGTMTPAGHLQYYRRLIDQAQEAGRRGYGSLSNWIADQMRQANAWALHQLVGDEGFQGDVRRAVDESIAQSPEVQQGIRDETAKDLGNLGPLVNEHMQGKGKGTLADKLKEQGVPNPEKTAVEIERQWRDGIERRRRQLPGRIREQRRGAPQTTDLDKLIARKLRDLRVKLADVVRRHYLEAAATGKRLADKLVLDAGFNGASAQMLAASIRARFNKIASARKLSILERMTTPKAREFARKDVAQRIIEFSNLGGFSEQRFWDAVAEKLGLPAFNSEVGAEIVRRSNALQLLPENSAQRLQAVQDLMNYIGRQKGIRFWDLAMSFFYANILSGPWTHVANVLSNAQSLVFSLGSAAARDITQIPRILEAAAHGFRRGMDEGVHVLRTGFSPLKAGKIEAQLPLELKRWEGWKAPLNAWKYVGRSLSAADTLFYLPAREAKAALLAADVAKREGRSGADLEARVSQLLGLRDDTGADRRAFAEALVMIEEGDLESVGQVADNNWRRRRLAEIIDQGRLPEIRENAHEYALRTTFNNKPYGLLGVVARGFNQMRREAPVLNMVVPFVNVVANVVNESLNYTPVGTFRAVLGHGGQIGDWRFGGEIYGRTASRDEVIDAHVKAALGTALLGGIAVLAAQGIGHEDDESVFQLYGAGPDDPDRRNQLRETGWIPYSVRIGGKWFSYGNSPLAIPLAIVGNYYDADRYGRLDHVDALSRVAWAVMQAGHVITQQSFLDSASGLFGMLDRTSPQRAGERFLTEVGRSASSFVVPNALRQVDRMFDPTVYANTDVQSAIVSSLPVVRAMGKPAINALGDPVTRLPTARFASMPTHDPIWDTLAAKQAWLSLPDPRDGLTKDDVYAITATRGPMLKKALAQSLPTIQRLKPEDAQKLVRTLTQQMTRAAEAKLKLLPSQRKQAVEK